MIRYLNQDLALAAVLTQPGRSAFQHREGAMEVVYPREGDPVALHPCPPWCSSAPHFGDDEVIDADDGYHHYGPEIAIPTTDRSFTDGPATVVKVILKSWTQPLDAEPVPARVELQLATTEHNTDRFAELTPGEARAVAGALLRIAGIVDNPGQD